MSSQYYVSKSKIILYSLLLFGVIIATLGNFFLPERFFFDVKTIQYANSGNIIGSYNFTNFFYQKIKLLNANLSVVGAIQYIICGFLIVMIGISRRFYLLNTKNGIAIFFFIILAIYMAMPTKEFITFLFYAGLLLFLLKVKIQLKHKLLIAFVLTIGFGLIFRIYFVVNALICVYLSIINIPRFRSKNFHLIFLGILLVISMTVAYGMATGSFISNGTRDFVNETRTENNNSQIVPPLTTDTWYGEATGVVYSFFVLHLSVNTFKHITTPQIVAFGIWQLFLFLTLYRRYGLVANDSEEEKLVKIVFHFVFAYFIMQSLFEPDLGSALRHKAGMFPLIYYLLYYEDFRKTA